MTLTVAQPLIPVFHPGSEDIPPNSSILDLEKENECLSCKEDFRPGETGILGHYTGVNNVWHAIHRDCLMQWCLMKVPPSTKMIPCMICPTLLNVRPLFPRNSVLGLMRVLRQMAPNIRLSVIGSGVGLSFFALEQMIDHLILRRTPLGAALVQNRGFHLLYAGVIFACTSFAMRAMDGLISRVMLEGDRVAIAVGVFSATAAAYLMNNSSLLHKQIMFCFGPLVTAIVAFVRALRR